MEVVLATRCAPTQPDLRNDSNIKPLFVSKAARMNTWTAPPCLNGKMTCQDDNNMSKIPQEPAGKYTLHSTSGQVS